MARNNERNLTTATTHQKGHAPATDESGMTMKEETTPTNIIKPDPEQSAAIPTTTPQNKRPKKANAKSSVDTEDISAPSPKNRKTKVSSLPMPTSWAEAGVADRMLVSMRDSGEDWAKIRKQWKEVTGSDTAVSTLPTRYSRLKASMTVLEDGDVSCPPSALFTPPALPNSVPNLSSWNRHIFFIYLFHSPWPGKSIISFFKMSHTFFFLLFFCKRGFQKKKNAPQKKEEEESRGWQTEWFE